MRSMWPGVLLMMIGCGHKTPQQKFVEFMNSPKNKIMQKITIGNVTATIKWMPVNYRKITDSLADKTEYNYFDIKFDKAGENKLTKEKTMYLDFDMQKDFTIVNGTDSIPPAICQRIQNGYSSSYEYMLAFEKQTKNDPGDFTVVYKDEIFGIGTIAFVYRREDIKKIPTLAAK